MSTKQGYLQERGTSNKLAPRTLSSLVKDEQRNQALSASLANMVERNALGFPVFNTTATYSEGDKVFYDRRLWTTKAGGHAAGAWSDNDFDEFTFKEYLDAVASTKANTDGFYESMGVGTAVNLAGQIERTNASMYRTSGGDEDIATGTARIEAIKGQTIAWNQKVQYLSSANYNNGTNGSASVAISDGTLTFTSDGTYYAWASLKNIQTNNTIIHTHKYLLHYNVVETNLPSKSTLVVSTAINKAPVVPADMLSSVGVKNLIVTYGGSADGAIGVVGVAAIESGSLPEGSRCVIKDIMLFDLTLIYGAGNEPSTPAQFEADYQKWFGKPLTYEPYDAGSLRSVKMSGLKTVGFNQWDEEWDLLGWKKDANNKVVKDTRTNRFSSSNLIKVFPSTRYYIKANYTLPNLELWFVDVDGNFISTSYPESNGSIFMTPKKCAYLAFFIVGQTTYNNDICINLSWSGVKNGTYEPYEEHTISIPTTTMTGKLNGEGESVVIFPDGMKGVNDVHDELYYVGGKTYAVKRVSRVEVGSLSWSTTPTVVSGKTRFITSTIYSMKPSAPKSVCSIYVKIEGTSFANNTGYDIDARRMIVYDEKYAQSDAATFKTAMSGVYFDYELETPLVYEVDDFTLPARYQVNDWGTEEQLQASGANGVAAIISCLYGVNAVDLLRRLPENYISKESMDNFLAALGTAMGGTWTKQWNEQNEEFDFSFVANSQPDNSLQSTNEGE